jgi:NADH dehydrogenase (ubiquinone) 1 alpha/beta subcomplex 1
MFRTAILRSVFRPAAVAVRTAAPRTLVAAPRFTVATPRVAAWAGAFRNYAASAGLSKQEVEDRIKALLQGFDKVSAFCLR